MTDTPAPVALLPCPFCGGRPKLQDLGDADSFYVHCTKCEVQQIANYSPEIASQRWNSRPPTEVFAWMVKEPSGDRAFFYSEEGAICAARLISGAVVIPLYAQPASGVALREALIEARKELDRLNQGHIGVSMLAPYDQLLAQIDAALPPSDRSGDNG